jgi:hypothetical protein
VHTRNALRFLTAFLLTLALHLSGPPSRAADISGHRPGLRDQWQPQTEHDPRLARPVHIEILARAAVPALEMLSKATGTTLQVAPENPNTVGERKLTIIAQGCSLKSIMVQIPNALREAHWDIDRSHPEPVYLLHRHSGVGLLPQEERQRALDRRHANRVARFGDLCHAIHLDDQQLAELRKTDLLLASALQDRTTRGVRGQQRFLTPCATGILPSAGRRTVSRSRPHSYVSCARKTGPTGPIVPTQSRMPQDASAEAERGPVPGSCLETGQPNRPLSTDRRWREINGSGSGGAILVLVALDGGASD